MSVAALGYLAGVGRSAHDYNMKEFDANQESEKVKNHATMAMLEHAMTREDLTPEQKMSAVQAHQMLTSTKGMPTAKHRSQANELFMGALTAPRQFDPYADTRNQMNQHADQTVATGHQQATEAAERVAQPSTAADTVGNVPGLLSGFGGGGVLAGITQGVQQATRELPAAADAQSQQQVAPMRAAAADPRLAPQTRTGSMSPDEIGYMHGRSGGMQGRGMMDAYGAGGGSGTNGANPGNGSFGGLPTFAGPNGSTAVMMPDGKTRMVTGPSYTPREIVKPDGSLGLAAFNSKNPGFVSMDLGPDGQQGPRTPVQANGLVRNDAATSKVTADANGNPQTTTRLNSEWLKAGPQKVPIKLDRYNATQENGEVDRISDNPFSGTNVSKRQVGTVFAASKKQALMSEREVLNKIAEDRGNIANHGYIINSDGTITIPPWITTTKDAQGNDVPVPPKIAKDSINSAAQTRGRKALQITDIIAHEINPAIDDLANDDRFGTFKGTLAEFLADKGWGDDPKVRALQTAVQHMEGAIPGLYGIQSEKTKEDYGSTITGNFRKFMGQSAINARASIEETRKIADEAYVESQNPVHEHAFDKPNVRTTLPVRKPTGTAPAAAPAARPRLSLQQLQAIEAGHK